VRSQLKYRLAFAVLILLLLPCWGQIQGSGFASGTGSAAEEPIPFKSQLTPSSDSLSRVITVFLLAVAGVVGGGYVLKKNLQKKGVIAAKSGNRIVVSETKTIAPKMTLYLVDIDRQEYLIAKSGEQIAIARHEKKSDGPIS